VSRVVGGLSSLRKTLVKQYNSLFAFVVMSGRQSPFPKSGLRWCCLAIGMTMDTYSHATPKMRDKAAEVMDDILQGIRR